MGVCLFDTFVSFVMWYFQTHLSYRRVYSHWLLKNCMGVVISDLYKIPPFIYYSIRLWTINNDDYIRCIQWIHFYNTIYSAEPYSNSFHCNKIYNTIRYRAIKWMQYNIDHNLTWCWWTRKGKGFNKTGSSIIQKHVDLLKRISTNFSLNDQKHLALLTGARTDAILTQSTNYTFHRTEINSLYL